MSKSISQMETTTTENAKGEREETTQVKTFKPVTEPSYIKLYLQDISYLNNLPNGTDKILYEFLKYLNYENEIVLTKLIKERIAIKLNLSLGHINNKIQSLAKIEVLIRVGQGVYSINTFIIAKGKWPEIMKHRHNLKLNLFYSEENGREIKENSMEKSNNVGAKLFDKGIKKQEEKKC